VSQVVRASIRREPVSQAEMLAATPSLAAIWSQHVGNLIFFILFLVYPGCIAKIFSAFQCISLPESGERFLRADLSINCDSERHQLLQWAYAAPMLIVFPLGVPLLLFLVLRKYRDRLLHWQVEEKRAECLAMLRQLGSTPSVPMGQPELTVNEVPLTVNEVRDAAKADHHIPLYVHRVVAGYALRFYYFELFEMARKLCLVGLSVAFEPGSVVQVAYGLLVCFVSFGAYMLCSPYEERQESTLAELCQLHVFVTLVASLILRTERSNGDTDGSGARSLDVVLLILTSLPIVLAVLFETRLPTLLLKLLCASQGARRDLLPARRDERAKQDAEQAVASPGSSRPQLMGDSHLSDELRSLDRTQETRECTPMSSRCQDCIGGAMQSQRKTKKTSFAEEGDGRLSSRCQGCREGAMQSQRKSRKTSLAEEANGWLAEMSTMRRIREGKRRSHLFEFSQCDPISEKSKSARFTAREAPPPLSGCHEQPRTIHQLRPITDAPQVPQQPECRGESSMTKKPLEGRLGGGTTQGRPSQSTLRRSSLRNARRLGGNRHTQEDFHRTTCQSLPSPTSLPGPSVDSHQASMDSSMMQLQGNATILREVACTAAESEANLHVRRGSCGSITRASCRI